MDLDGRSRREILIEILTEILTGDLDGGFDGSLGRDPDGDSLEGIGGRRGEFDEGLDGDFDGSLGMGPD